MFHECGLKMDCSMKLRRHYRKDCFKCSERSRGISIFYQSIKGCYFCTSTLTKNSYPRTICNSLFVHESWSLRVEVSFQFQGLTNHSYKISFDLSSYSDNVIVLAALHCRIYGLFFKLAPKFPLLHNNDDQHARCRRKVQKRFIKVCILDI